MIDTLHPTTERIKRTIHFKTLGSWYHQMRDDVARAVALARAEWCLQRARTIPTEQHTPYLLAGYEFAGLRYNPPTLEVETLVFRATESEFISDDDECWRRSTRGHLVVRAVPGTHLSIVRTSGGLDIIGRSLVEALALLSERKTSLESSGAQARIPSNGTGRVAPGMCG
jgi:hypothetical protein